MRKSYFVPELEIRKIEYQETMTTSIADMPITGDMDEVEL